MSNVFYKFFLSTVLQKFKMPCTSCSLFLGLASRRMNSYNTCHRFSTGLASGDSGGVFHQWTPLSSKKVWASLEVCLGSLSCIKRCPLGKTACRKGSNVFSRICTYSGACMIPSNLQIPVLPLTLTPAHTCTFTGCFALKEGNKRERGKKGIQRIKFSIHEKQFFK